MENDDPVIALMARLESLIEEVIDRKFTDRDQKLEAMAETLRLTHDLVNSRMTELTAALKKAAALASVLAGEEGEERGAANERKRASRDG
jgi:hypothetical protein